MNKSIQLPQKVLRDLDNWYRFINEAIDHGTGKYRCDPAWELHAKRVFYYFIRYSSTPKSLKRALEYLDKLDVKIPYSLEEYLCHYANRKRGL